MMERLERMVKLSAEMGAARTLELLGLHSGEVSQRKARDTYGKWFLDAERDGRISPVRVEPGRTGTRWYRVVDILALKVRDAAPAELKMEPF